MVYDFVKIKNWSPEIEKSIIEKWKKSEMFKFNKNSKKKTYSIDTPPPYVNAPIHIGQAITYCYMDFFARYKRMKGFQVIFPLGLDRNGLPIEMAAEKKFNISPFKIGRDEFIKKCKELLKDTSSETEDTFAKLGISFTSYKKGNHVGSVYMTDSPEYRKITQATFIGLFKRGLIYEDTRINNWDPKLQTTIADSEIDYKDMKSTFNTIKWKVKETGEEILIATTRPELIGTCSAVIFNPKDKRYKHLEKRNAIIPLYGKSVPIMAHPFAKIDKGTGLVMMCAGGDLTDVQFIRETKLKPIIAVSMDGKMNEKSDFLEGLEIREAREKIIDLLKEKSLVVRQEKILHRTPISERSGAEVEFIEMPEFYLKQIKFKKDIKRISKEINFFPKKSKKILDSWIDSISIDWPISRRRFYATPIPLWNADLNGEKIIAVGGKGKYYEPWKQNPEKDFDVFKKGKKVGKVKDFKVSWNGEERVLDTWMDSSISELVLLKYLEDDKFFKKSYPSSLRPQGKEIIRTWLYYTLLRGYLETGKASFENVWINQHILDEKGKKMSKSKGNIVDPQKLIKSYGAEAIRLWASIEGDLSKQDLRCSEERIRAELKTLTKLLNVSKFVMLFEKPKTKPKLTKLDELFIDYFDYETHHIDFSYNIYDFYKPAVKLRNFLWNEFASHYIELVKARAYNQEKNFSKTESESAKYTLYFLLERLLVLFHPIIPQITDFISKELKINFETFPMVNYSEVEKRVKADDKLWLINLIMKFNSEVWNTKKKKKISLRDEISGIKIPKQLKSFEQDLIVTHNLK